jgi:hypothetical protein
MEIIQLIGEAIIVAGVVAFFIIVIILAVSNA